MELKMTASSWAAGFSRSRLILGTIESLWIKDEVVQRILKDFLILLKDAVYDGDNLLDEFRYRILKQQVERQRYEASNGASSSSDAAPPPSKKTKTSISSFTSDLSRKGDDDDDDDVQRMRKIKECLDGMSEKITICYPEDDRGKKHLVSTAIRQTSSFSIEPQFFGRDKEVQKLKDLLLKPEVTSEFGQNEVSVLSVTGIGGIGKITLVQKVFNDSSIEEYFKFRIWVCVFENFCTDRLIREIVEYATEEKCDLINFASPREILKEKITSERFLLVLDDVWNEDRHKWESLCAPLRSGKPGSKILVTTRSRKIANIVGDVDAIHLDGMDEESFWELFKKYAFGYSHNGVYNPSLEVI